MSESQYDPARLRDIEARLERATGPDRELDGEIMFSLFAVPVGVNGFLWPEDNPSWSFAIRFPGKDREWFKKYPDKETILVWRNGDPILMNDIRVPKLSASIDAADALLTRLLPGWILFTERGRKDGFVLAAVCEPVEGDNPRARTIVGDARGYGKTLATMIVLATIRALIARHDVPLS